MWYKYKMNKKHTMEEIKIYIENFDYTLLSTEYKNNKTKLNMMCDKNHEFSMRFDSFVNGRRCPICAGNIKLTLKEIKEYVESFGYKLLSKEYINTHSKLVLKCPKDHIYNVSNHNFKNGDRCPVCMDTKHTYEYIKQNVENRGYKLLSDSYKNNKTKIKLKCPEGHIIEMLYLNFQKGSGCFECFGIHKKTLEEVKEFIESFEYHVLTTEYENIKTKIKLRCPKGHIYSVLYNNFKKGSRCPICSENKAWSKPEKEIIEYVKTIYSGKVIENNRSVVKNYWTGYGLELDVWIPELNKAIEFNGEYWHNKNNDVKWKDEMKKKQCIQKNIDLYIIQEQDWYNDKVSCLNKINKLIGV